MHRPRQPRKEAATRMTKYYLFRDDGLVQVVDDIRAFGFANGQWTHSPSHTWKVTGMSGDCDFEDLTPDQAKKLFPKAFA